MRLAVTVGFESKLVIRAITRLGPTRGVVFLRGITGREGDRQSEETVRDLVKILGYGEDVAVDLRDLEEAFGKLAEIDFDAVALAGGPRLLVVLAFHAAMYRGRGVYVVPEYDPEPIDVSHLARLPSISALSPTRLRILASLDGDKTYREVASDVGGGLLNGSAPPGGLVEAGACREGRRQVAQIPRGARRGEAEQGAVAYKISQIPVNS